MTLENTSDTDKTKAGIRKIPVVSGLVTWLYRLLKLPGRFHEMNDFVWKIFGRLEQDEIRMKDANTNLENLRGQISTVSRDLETLHRALREKAGLTSNEIVKELAKQDLSSGTYFYCAFENRYRGAKEEIRKTQLQYVEHIEKARADSKGEFALDVGCGRGEFLKLLKEKNIPARGIDNTRSMIEACQQDHLNAELVDAMGMLRNLKENSLIALTAFQVVEHLPADYLVEMVRSAHTKVAAGGVIILETVNPGSVSSLQTFYLDLTHRNPIPWETLKFLVETAGFRQVTVQFSSPIPDHLKLQGTDPNIQKLNNLLFGPQDYAIIGWK